MKQYELNRKEYKEVKKMDHGQMSDFCGRIYQRGYEAGKKEAAGLSEAEVRQALLGVKGIGDKKAEDIVQALTAAQEERKALTVMKKDQQFIRQGIILGFLKFGVAFKKEGSSQYDYYISPIKFWEETGYVYDGAEA